MPFAVHGVDLGDAHDRRSELRFIDDTFSSYSCCFFFFFNHLGYFLRVICFFRFFVVSRFRDVLAVATTATTTTATTTTTTTTTRKASFFSFLLFLLPLYQALSTPFRRIHRLSSSFFAFVFLHYLLRVHRVVENHRRFSRMAKRSRHRGVRVPQLSVYTRDVVREQLNSSVLPFLPHVIIVIVITFLVIITFIIPLLFLNHALHRHRFVHRRHAGSSKILLLFLLLFKRITTIFVMMTNKNQSFNFNRTFPPVIFRPH